MTAFCQRLAILFQVELNVIEFALRRCAEFVKTKQHEDIDVLETQTVWEYQWDNFITQYYKVVNDGQILKDNKEGISIKVRKRLRFECEKNASTV